MTDTFNADQVFAALADATRRDIVLRALSGHEGVAELASHYPMSFAAVQKHVAVLERAGLVSKERTGRRKVVRTNMAALRLARGLLDEYEALWPSNWPVAPDSWRHWRGASRWPRPSVPRSGRRPGGRPSGPHGRDAVVRYLLVRGY